MNYRLELKQESSKVVSEELGGSSFHPILSKVCAFFDGGLYSRSRTNLPVNSRYAIDRRCAAVEKVKTPKPVPGTGGWVAPKGGIPLEFLVQGVTDVAGVESRPAKTFYSYTAMTFTTASNIKVRTYFERYPLQSSKRLNFKDWCLVLELFLAKKHLTPEGRVSINLIKSNYNSKRTQFNWDH